MASTSVAFSSASPVPLSVTVTVPGPPRSATTPVSVSGGQPSGPVAYWSGQASAVSRTPSPSSSASHASPWASPSVLRWSRLGTLGQLSDASGIVSMSASDGPIGAGTGSRSKTTMPALAVLVPMPE